MVALKIIAPEIAANERVVARFQREMKLVGRLDHPNVVRAFDADQIQKILYIVMEYVAGTPITNYCRTRRLDLNGRLQLFLQLRIVLLPESREVLRDLHGAIARREDMEQRGHPAQRSVTAVP